MTKNKEFKIQLKRELSQRRDQTSQIEWMKSRIVSGNRARWEITSTEIEFLDLQENGRYLYTVDFTFEKTSGHTKNIDREWQGMEENLAKLGQNTKFQPYPWTIVRPEGWVKPIIDAVVNAIKGEGGSFIEVSEVGQVSHALSNNTGITLQEVKERALPLITTLLEDEDELNKSPFFQGIFGRNAQIRCVLSSVKSFLETDGARRSHCLLFGRPGCGKTNILSSVIDLLGDDSTVRLDGTSLTAPGLYKIYFDELKDIPEPPFVLLEEAEKTTEEALRVWLGVLDDRGELRKINARQMSARKMKVLCMATANDKSIFDRVMGGSASGGAGALSSRFVTQLNCPRPDSKILEMILRRDIDAYGGEESWIKPVIELAQELKTDDPRKVLSFLSGGSRLISGDFQRDLIAIKREESAENLP